MKAREIEILLFLGSNESLWVSDSGIRDTSCILDGGCNYCVWTGSVDRRKL